MPNRISNDFTSTIAGSVFTKAGEDIIKPPVGHEFVGFTTLADTVLYSKPDFTYPSGQTFYERKDFMQVETGNIIAYYGRVVPKSKVKKILNEFTGAAAAYSLRELSNEVDNVVRVRRSTDSFERDFTANEVTDGTLTDFVGTGNDGFVTSWYDQSGNRNTATQTSASAQPKIVDAGSLVTINSKPAIQSSGAETLVFTNTTTDGFSAKSVFAVSSFEQTDSADRFLYSDNFNFSNESQIKTGGTSDNRVTFANQTSGTNYNSDYVVMAQDDLSLLTSIFDGSSSDIYLDGVLGTGTAYKGTDNIVPFATAWLFSKNGTSSFWIGKHCEIIIYTTDQSSNQSGIEANITNNYSI